MRIALLLLWLHIGLFTPSTKLQHIPNGNNQLTIDGMHIEWDFDGSLLTFTMQSPYQGWLALGFNERNDFLHSHLVQANVTHESVNLREQYVVGYGQQESVSTLGGQEAIIKYFGQEDDAGTFLQFTIDTKIEDAFHYPLKEGGSIWLICAYSMADDFGTPSIMQRRIEIVL